MSGTGLKKWSPSTWPGRLVAAAIAVTLQDEVFEASSACGGQIRSSLAKVSFLSGWFSVMASITRSQSRRPSRPTTPVMPAHDLVAGLLVEPRLGHQRVEALAEPAEPAIEQLLGRLRHDRGEAGLRGHLDDARPHQPTAQHSDGPHGHAWCLLVTAVRGRPGAASASNGRRLARRSAAGARPVVRGQRELVLDVARRARVPDRHADPGLLVPHGAVAAAAPTRRSAEGGAPARRA